MWRKIRTRWLDLLLLVLLLFLLIPGLSFPFKVAVQRLFLASPKIDLSSPGTTVSYEWGLYDLDGKKQNMAASRGRLVFLNHWATWCPPCVAELPAISRLYDRYKEQLDFYLVSTEEPARLKEFLNDRKLDLPVYRPAAPAPPGLEGTALPTTYLIDTNGRVVHKEVGSARWDSDGIVQVLERMLQNESSN